MEKTDNTLYKIRNLLIANEKLENDINKENNEKDNIFKTLHHLKYNMKRNLPEEINNVIKKINIPNENIMEISKKKKLIY